MDEGIKKADVNTLIPAKEKHQD
jgi:hypothetical protein